MKKLPILCTAILLVLVPVSAALGCQQQPEPTPEPEPTQPAPTIKLAIRNVQLCSHISEEGEYTVQPESTFNRGDTVWLYFEIPGLKAKKVDDKYESCYKVTEFRIYDPDDSIISNIVDIGEDCITADEPPDFIWFKFWWDTETSDAVGQHRWEFVVKDGLSGAIGTGSATFNLQ